MLDELGLTGVFLADYPVDCNEGAHGDQVLAVDLGHDLAAFELVEDGKPYREWCAPASLLNAGARVRLLAENEVDDLTRARLGRQARPS